MVQSRLKGFTLQPCRDQQLRLIPKLFAKCELFKHQNMWIKAPGFKTTRILFKMEY